MTVGKLSKYRNRLFTEMRNELSTMYDISKDSEKSVEENEKGTEKNESKLVPVVIIQPISHHICCNSAMAGRSLSKFRRRIS
jgi:hypothetical protein